MLIRTTKLDATYVYFDLMLFHDIDLYDGRTFRPETIDGDTRDPGSERKNPHVS